MDRFDEKRDLMLDYCDLVAQLNRFDLPKPMRRRFYREMNNDINKGLKDINKKIPIGIEMPSREQVGNGMYKETYDNTPPDSLDVVVCSDNNIALPNENELTIED